MNKHLSSKTFAKQGKGTVAKTANASPLPTDTARTLRFIISTNAVDRDNDSVNQDGWDLEHYKGNPIVLWGHNSDDADCVIGKCIDISVVDGDLQATVEFVPETINPKAEMVYQLCLGGFVSATSVGFLPLEWTYSDEREGGIDFAKAQLLEFSIVSVPCNPEALIVSDDVETNVRIDNTILLNNDNEKARWKIFADALYLKCCEPGLANPTTTKKRGV